MKLDELAGRLGARLVGDGSAEIDGCAGLETADANALAFYANRRYRTALEATRAGAVLVDAATADELGAGATPLLVHENPYAAYARALALFHPEPRPEPGVHPSAVVEDGADIDPTATVGPFCFVAAGARIGPRTVLQSHVHVARDARIGADGLVQAGCVIRERCILGDRVRLQPRVVIGADGFGYALDHDDNGLPMHRKVPQVGIVRIEDDVEIGAGSCIDRATTGETVIGRGCIVDNLVQVGHNVEVGALSVLCGQVGIAGSTKVGRGVVLAGQVGLAGHQTIGDGAVFGAKAGVVGDMAGGEQYAGFPAIPHKQWLRAMAVVKSLPDLVRRVRRLERRAGADED